MSQPVMEALGIEVYSAELQLQDFLWFSSYDSGGSSLTEPAIHNYALTYAINRYERTVCWGYAPSYEADLAQMSIYCTPARPTHAMLETITYNGVDERTHRTDAEQEINTPMLGRRRVIVPYVRGEPVTFQFYVFKPPDAPLPRVVRLGKKRAPVTVSYRRLPDAGLVFGDGVPSHLINPLDLSGTVRQFRPIGIPPNLLLDDALLQGDWFIRAGGDVVQTPRRLLALRTEQT